MFFVGFFLMFFFFNNIYGFLFIITFKVNILSLLLWRTPVWQHDHVNLDFRLLLLLFVALSVTYYFNAFHNRGWWIYTDQTLQWHKVKAVNSRTCFFFFFYSSTLAVKVNSSPRAQRSCSCSSRSTGNLCSPSSPRRSPQTLPGCLLYTDKCAFDSTCRFLEFSTTD